MFDMALRVVLFGSGVAIAAHYMLMANFMKRAPHAIKAVALPAITASGVGMAVCSVIGEVHLGLIGGTIAAWLMVFVNLSAWAAGAYVSDKFEKAAQIREQINRDGWVFVKQFDQIAEAAKILDDDCEKQKARHNESY